MSAIVRDYKPSDFAAIKAIHESTGIDYNMPDLNSPIFLVKKVIEVDGTVRVAGGAYIQVELYLWLDQSDWADPDQKLAAIKTLDQEVILDTWLQGVDQAVLWLPPGLGRFGERLTKQLGFEKDRDGWITYSKLTEPKQ